MKILVQAKQEKIPHKATQAVKGLKSHSGPDIQSVMYESQKSLPCTCEGGCPRCKSRNKPMAKNNPLNQQINEVLKSENQSLDASACKYFERIFNYDFSRVKINTSAKGAASARALNASAYTMGNTIVFGREQYEPRTKRGSSLIAHELVHVVQQNSAIGIPAMELSLAPENGEQEEIAGKMLAAIANGEYLKQIKPFKPQIMRAVHPYSLSFDDGPHTAELDKGINRTEKVLKTLEEKKIKAVFFIQLYRAKTKSGLELLKRMQKAGHEIGIHTGGKLDHESHTAAEAKGSLAGELEATKEYIKKETGQAPSLVRPPGGKYDEKVKSTYKKAKLTLLLWDIEGDRDCSSLADLKSNIDKGIRDVAAKDWKGTTFSKTIVILYHDIKQNTSENLGAVIDYIRTATKQITAEIAEEAMEKAAEAKKQVQVLEEELKKAMETLKEAQAAKNSKGIAQAKINVDAAVIKRDKAKKKLEIAEKRAILAEGHIGSAEFSLP